MVISNELPNFGDASGAIARRFVVLTMRNSWLGRENTALTAELLTEMPAILAWSLDGLDRLAKNGRFTEPASSTDAIVALQDLVSPTSAFVRDECCTEPGHGHDTPIGALFTSWKNWCEENGQRPGTAQTLGRQLRAVVPGLRTDRPRDGESRERRYLGIGLRGLNKQCAGPRTMRTTDLSGPHGPRSDPLLSPPDPPDPGPRSTDVDEWASLLDQFSYDEEGAA